MYKIHIDSYREIKEVKTLKSCGISQWDEEVERIVRNMLRWTPTIHHRGKGEYKDAIWAIPVILGQRTGAVGSPRLNDPVNCKMINFAAP